MSRLLLAHRRLAILMGVAAILAFIGGAGLETPAVLPAAALLAVAFFWQPSPELSQRMETFWLPLVLVLVIRALFHVFQMEGDVVVPVVDLLMLLLAAESLRSLDANNDVRLYTISFALLLASTIYRPSILFGFAFVAFLLLATLALMIGHLRVLSERHRAKPVHLTRGFVTAATGVSTVILVMSVLVFVAFPRVSQGWAGVENPTPMSMAGFSDQVALGSHGARIRPNPRIVLRVTFPDGPPEEPGRLYWRGRAFDHFDGMRWSRSDDLAPSAMPSDWYEHWGGLVRQRILSAASDSGVLFGLHPVGLISIPSRRANVLPDVAGDFTDGGREVVSYEAWSATVPPPPDVLRRPRRGRVPSPLHHLQLPELPDRIRTLADSLAAGHDTQYDRARAVERWFHEEFTYTLQLPRTPREATVDHFLFERRAGHCEYFSTGMVVLLRAMGIPSREVNGFLGGEWNDFGEYLAVSQNQAHAWVEVWFPQIGWVIFDPTPPGTAGAAGTTAWSWPGRHFLDGLQYRWDRWVLEYGFEEQSDLLDRTSGIFDALGDPSATGTSLGGRIRARFWIAGLVLAGLLGAWLFRRAGRRHSPESRVFLRLRAFYERAGIAGAAALSPLDFLDRLRRDRAPGLSHAERVVDLYLRARFSPRGIGDAGRREMSSSLKAARRAVRHAARGAARETIRGAGPERESTIGAVQGTAGR
ncbi:MAG: DUF3488 and transglutaminase-like domain-containing protein [Gemmatimonadota bacterium]